MWSSNIPGNISHPEFTVIIIKLFLNRITTLYIKYLSQFHEGLSQIVQLKKNSFSPEWGI